MKSHGRRTSVRKDRVRDPGEAWQTLMRRVATSTMALGILAMVTAHLSVARADSIPTTVMDPNLVVTPVASGFPNTNASTNGRATILMLITGPTTEASSRE